MSHYAMVVLAVLAFGCTKSAGNEMIVHGAPGAPLEGLSDANLGRFALGLQLFNRQFTPEEGLGPLFNEERCSSCHDVPAIGGTGVEFATIATRFVPPDQCDQLVNEGGSNVQQHATPLLLAQGVRSESRLPSATARSTVSPPSLFGLGLVEAVPLSTLERLADPNDEDGNGVSGRIGRTREGQPARFGRKAEFATVRDFTEGALRFEMGLTTPENPVEETLNGTPLSSAVDPAPDPEVTQAEIDLLTDFVRFLGPVTPFIPRAQEQRDAVAMGERLFGTVGCADCHVPILTTGPSDVPELSEKAFHIYSDLLLHDLGPRLAGVCGPGALPTEYRTARLTGLRHRGQFLHDGSAGSVWMAIVAHGGEASMAQTSFLNLRADDQSALIEFVASR